MDHDFDMGNDIKDDIIPLALEYYLGVIEKEDSDDDDDNDDDDDDEDEKPKKKNKKQPKVAPGGGPKGPNGEECK
jgi:nucleosome assembly protein 1-like 1